MNKLILAALLGLMGATQAAAQGISVSNPPPAATSSSTGTHTDGGNASFNRVVADQIVSTGTAPSLTATGAVILGSTFSLMGDNGLRVFTVDDSSKAVLGNQNGAFSGATLKESGYFIGTGGAGDITTGYRGFNIFYDENYRFGARVDRGVFRVLELFAKSGGNDGEIAFRTGNDTEYMRLNATGNLGIGTASPASKLDILISGTKTSGGDNRANSVIIDGPDVAMGAAGHPHNLIVTSNDALGADLGGSIGLGGKYTGNSGAVFAVVKAGKENGTDGQYGGYMSLGVRANGGNVFEAVRIAPEGGIRPYSRTIAQLLAIAPKEAGEMFFCSNCSPVKMVVSTGTAAGNFADIMGGAFQ